VSLSGWRLLRSTGGCRERGGAGGQPLRHQPDHSDQQHKQTHAGGQAIRYSALQKTKKEYRLKMQKVEALQFLERFEKFNSHKKNTHPKDRAVLLD